MSCRAQALQMGANAVICQAERPRLFLDDAAGAPKQGGNLVGVLPKNR